MERCECCGSIIKIGDISNFLKIINDIIERDDLNTKSRSRHKTHKRYFLYKKMREKGLSFEGIGNYFGRDHATVMHGINKHDLFSEQKDTVYLKDTEGYDNLFQINQ
jgi:chromosomal replication initiation ATPase DnaA